MTLKLLTHLIGANVTTVIRLLFLLLSSCYNYY